MIKSSTEGLPVSGTYKAPVAVVMQQASVIKLPVIIELDLDYQTKRAKDFEGDSDLLFTESVHLIDLLSCCKPYVKLPEHKKTKVKLIRLKPKSAKRGVKEENLIAGFNPVINALRNLMFIHTDSEVSYMQNSSDFESSRVKIEISIYDSR